MDGSPIRRRPGFDSPQSRHKSLHFRSSPSPMAWKDAYRQKCIQRLRSGREKLLNKFRNVNAKLADGDFEEQEGMETDGGSDENANLRVMMREEWNLLMKGNKFGGNDDFDFDEEEMVKMMEEVEAELKMEKEAILREYERTLAADEAELCAVVEDYLSTSDEDVICPFCSSGRLEKRLHNVVFCVHCAAQLHLEADAVSLRDLKSRLERAAESHAAGHGRFDGGSEGCSARPVFSLLEEPTTHCQNLTLLCAVCDHFQIVV